jgi:hypothetical protein
MGAVAAVMVMETAMLMVMLMAHLEVWAVSLVV